MLEKALDEGLEDLFSSSSYVLHHPRGEQPLHHQSLLSMEKMKVMPPSCLSQNVTRIH